MALFDLGKRLTHRRVQNNIANSCVYSPPSEISNISSLLAQHKVACGYIPYIHGQTRVFIYNFFSINYGIRNPLHLFVSLTDQNFNPLHTIYRSIETRESLLFDFNDIETSILNQPTFIVVFVANRSLRPNHGGAGGHLRFWGIWGNTTASTHSWPLPGFRAFLRSFLNQSQDTPFERRFYPNEAPLVSNFSAFNLRTEVTSRGDLSLNSNLPPGFTFLFDKQHRVKSVFHGRNLKRSFNAVQDGDSDYNHVVSIPAILYIDCQLWFSECCSNGSSFDYQVFNSNHDTTDQSPRLLFESSLTVTGEPILLSDLLPSNILGYSNIFVVFRPKSGLFAPFYINCIYLFNDNNELHICDSVHSHSFASIYDKGFKRALKFFPFNLSDALIQASSCNTLAIWGSSDDNSIVRLRILVANDPQFEYLTILNVLQNSVLFVDLDYVISKHLPANLHSSPCIAQIECDTVNLNASLFCSYSDPKLHNSSILVDHLTGG